MTDVLFLTFDLNDAATWRRVAMLRAGGARVRLAGFHRGPPLARPEGLAPVLLGATQNGRMGRRVLSVLRGAFRARRAFRAGPRPDVILARNLETLALVPALRRLWPGRPPDLVYECLDIHRMMLGDTPRARLLRAAEGALLRPARLVLTSSPGFLRHYFRPVHPGLPVRLVENRVLPGHPAPAAPAPPGPGEPFRIGWFGVLRCAASLAVLDALTRSLPGRFRVVLRGRPALDAVPCFHATTDANPDICYLGPYDPADLPAAYGDVHLSWLIDRYEAGQNSDWLLPNRLYEGGASGAVPVALAGTETAAFLARRGLGIAVPSLAPDALAAALGGLDRARWQALSEAVRAAPRSTWVAGEEDCAALVAAIAGLSVTGRLPAATRREATS